MTNTLTTLGTGTVALLLSAIPLTAQKNSPPIKFPTKKTSPAHSKPSTKPLWQFNVKGIGG